DPGTNCDEAVALCEDYLVRLKNEREHDFEEKRLAEIGFVECGHVLWKFGHDQPWELDRTRFGFAIIEPIAHVPKGTAELRGVVDRDRADFCGPIPAGAGGN